tara:strand:- start:116 stop:1249 length:1134 start_codon:yes stop_codon:yes gene_type:complete
MIKFWTYKNEYSKYSKKLLKVINDTINNGTIFFGKELNKFEKKFKKKYKSKYGVAVGSGTDALSIAIKSLGINHGDEIITAANTAIPTISAIILAGATPVLADVGEDFLIDPKKIRKVINSKTKAIIPVHLYGQACNMTEINKIAKKYKIDVIEDCAQAQGAKYKNKFVGTFGKFGCFSFYPTKILGAYGDGGFILTKNYNLHKKIKRLRFYGIETEDKKNKYFNQYYSNENGINSRLDEIQSSILNFKLNYINSFIKKRRKLAKKYIDELRDTGLKLPYENLYSRHVYHLFTVYHPKGNKIIKEMRKKNIETRKVYPFPIHTMKAYKNYFSNRKNLKNSEIKSKGIFCLPLYPELSEKKIMLICKNLKKILHKIKK